jgi:hypothetical protein
MRIRGFLASLWLVVSSLAVFADGPDVAGARAMAKGKGAVCDEFYSALSAVPHAVLSRHSGAYKGHWDKKQYSGCTVEFRTTDALRAGKLPPTFHADEGTEMYRAGWRRIQGSEADGPGTQIFSIDRGAVECVVSSDQPAYFDVATDEIVVSDTLEVIVQCRAR